MADRLNWSQGKWGAGTIHSDGAIETWAGEQPHEQGVADFHITPEGGIHNLLNRSAWLDHHLIANACKADHRLFDSTQGNEKAAATKYSDIGAMHAELKIPQPSCAKIRKWVDSLEWPDDSEKEDQRNYHITILTFDEYSEEFIAWMKKEIKGRTFEFESDGLDLFGDVVVLRLSCPSLRELAIEWGETAYGRSLGPRRFPGGPKAHVTVGFGAKNKPRGIQDPNIGFTTAEFNVNVNEKKSGAPASWAPPLQRPHSDRKHSTVSPQLIDAAYKAVSSGDMGTTVDTLVTTIMGALHRLHDPNWNDYTAEEISEAIGIATDMVTSYGEGQTDENELMQVEPSYYQVESPRLEDPSALDWTPMPAGLEQQIPGYGEFPGHVDHPGFPARMRWSKRLGTRITIGDPDAAECPQGHPINALDSAVEHNLAHGEPVYCRYCDKWYDPKEYEAQTLFDTSEMPFQQGVQEGEPLRATLGEPERLSATVRTEFDPHGTEGIPTGKLCPKGHEVLRLSQGRLYCPGCQEFVSPLGGGTTEAPDLWHQGAAGSGGSATFQPSIALDPKSPANELKTWLDSFANPPQDASGGDQDSGWISPHHQTPLDMVVEPTPTAAQGHPVDPPAHPFEPYNWAEDEHVASDHQPHGEPDGEENEAKIPGTTDDDYEQAKRNWYERAWDAKGWPMPYPPQPMHWRHDHDPQIKSAGTTRQQLLEMAQGLPNDASHVVHQWPDGWTMRELRDLGDMWREGELMSNCWSPYRTQDEARPDQMYVPEWQGAVDELGVDLNPQKWNEKTQDWEDWSEAEHEDQLDWMHQTDTRQRLPEGKYLSLRDPDNIPHASIKAEPSFMGNYYSVDALGRHNDLLKPQYGARVAEYLATDPRDFQTYDGNAYTPEYFSSYSG